MGTAKRPRRVALVYDVLYPWVRGGAEKRLWEIARRLPAHGFEPHLVGPRYWDGARSIMRDGVWLHGIAPPRPLYTSSGTRSIAEAVAFARDLLPALLRLRVDLVDCCAFPYVPWYSVRVATAWRRVPLLTTWPEVWGPYWRSYLGMGAGLLAQGVEAGVVWLSTDHLCPSGFTARRLEALGGPRGRRITPLPAGIDATAMASFAAPRHLRGGLLFVGRLLAHKRVADLLRALVIVRHTRPATMLTIVGEGPDESGLRSLVGDLGLQNSVVFRSGLDEHELYSLMGRAQCLVLPSEREGQGMVVAEAQATGTPPVVARGPESAAPDFVRDDVDGLLYPVGDVHALAECLDSLLSADGPAERHSTGAFQAAAALDWDTAILPRLAALYESLLVH